MAAVSWCKENNLNVSKVFKGGDMPTLKYVGKELKIFLDKATMQFVIKADNSDNQYLDAKDKTQDLVAAMKDKIANAFEQ